MITERVGGGENYTMKSFLVSNPHRTLLCIIRVLESVRMRWAGCVLCMGREIGHRALFLKSEGMNRLEDLYVNEEILLKWILKTLDTRAWILSS